MEEEGNEGSTDDFIEVGNLGTFQKIILCTEKFLDQCLKGLCMEKDGVHFW